MLVVGCLCLTALLNGNNLPRLFAFATPTAADQPPLVLDPPAQSTPMPLLQTAPPISLNPVAPALPVLSRQPAVEPPQPAPRLVPAKKAAPDVRYYAGHKYIYSKTIRLRVTAYAPDIRCTWPYPGTTTASGLSVKTNRGRLVAADPRLIPLHSLVAVPGYASGAPVPVLDTGGAIKGSRLDVLLPNFDQAKDWGTQTLSVRVYEPAD